MRSSAFFVSAALAIFLLTGSASAAHAATAVKKTPAPKYQRIFYYLPSTKAFADFEKHISSVDFIAPQTYTVDPDGAVTGSVNPDLLALAAQHNVKVMPLLINAHFSRTGAQAFLDDTVAQDNAITALVTEAQDKGYWGWQIDFEQVDASYAGSFSAFVKRFGDAMKKNKLGSSVAVIAKTSDNPDDYPKSSWQNVVGVFDYKALAASTDFLSIMSYDDPWSTGPIARYSWLKDVLKYATKVVPARKLSLGLPLYYWKWNTVTGKHVGTGNYDGILTTLQTRATVRGYNTTYQAPYIKYRVKKSHYILWYENSRSIAKKISLMKAYGMHGFSAWSIGQEVPNIFDSIRK